MAVGDFLGVRLNARTDAAVWSADWYYETTTEAGGISPTIALASAVNEVCGQLLFSVSVNTHLESTYAWVQVGLKVPPGRAMYDSAPGQRGLHPIDSVISAVVSWRQAMSGARHNGRSHISGLAETDCSGNVITGVNVVTFLQAWGDAMVSVNAFAGDYTARMVLRGTAGKDEPDPGSPVWRPVTSVSTSDILGSVRRRKSRIRGTSNVLGG